MDSNLAADSAGEAADQVSPTPQIDQKYRLHLSQTTILVIFFLSHFSCVFMLFHVLPILVNKDVCFHTVIWLFHHVYEWLQHFHCHANFLLLLAPWWTLFVWLIQGSFTCWVSWSRRQCRLIFFVCRRLWIRLLYVQKALLFIIINSVCSISVILSTSHKQTMLCGILKIVQQYRHLYVIVIIIIILSFESGNMAHKRTNKQNFTLLLCVMFRFHKVTPSGQALLRISSVNRIFLTALVR